MNFTEVTTNTRTAYDLKHQGGGRFSVSEDIFNRLNLSENGFILLEDQQSGILALKLVPNERAGILKGSKGRNFNNKVLAHKLERSNNYSNNEFEFEQRLEEVGDDVYILTPHNIEQQESHDDELDNHLVQDSHVAQEQREAIHDKYVIGRTSDSAYYNEEQEEITNH